MKQNALADRIRWIMRQRGFTQKDLADYLSISQPAVSLYLQGRMPPADILLQIAKLGETTVEWLLTGTDTKETHGSVREEIPLYGNQYLLLKLWKQIPENVQRDILQLLHHLVENQSK